MIYHTKAKVAYVRYNVICNSAHSNVKHHGKIDWRMQIGHDINMRLFHTVLAPVICAKASCSRLPSLCSSSSITLYVAPISLNTFLAILQYGQVVLENMTMQL